MCCAVYPPMAQSGVGLGLWYMHIQYIIHSAIRWDRHGLGEPGRNSERRSYRILHILSIDIVRRWATNIQTAPSPLDEEDPDPLLNLRKIYHYSCTTVLYTLHLPPKDRRLRHGNTYQRSSTVGPNKSGRCFPKKSQGLNLQTDRYFLDSQ